MNLTDFQRRMNEIPPEINLALPGGRGSGKSTGIAFAMLKHSERVLERAAMVYVRRSYPALRDFEQVERNVFNTVYGADARYSANDHVWRLPRGGFLENAQIDCYADLQKMQGRSITLLTVDEIGQYADSTIFDMLRSNLRAPKGITTRTIVACNPGAVGQAWVYKRWMLGKEPWKAYRDEHGAWWMYCPSTVDDNESIDRDAYRQQLRAACAHDPELLKAWLSGDFTSATGSYFGHVFDEKRNVVDLPAKVPIDEYGKPWPTYLALDFGSAAPSVCYLMCESPGGKIGEQFFPRDSLIALDEYAVYRRNNLNQGLGWTAATLGEALKEWCDGWKVSPDGVADDACFAKTGHTGGSIAQEMAAKGVRFYAAQKGERIPGWQALKRMLADAGTPDRPGFFLSRRCEYALQTLPFLARDMKRPEDCDSSGPDHAADALRYALRRFSPAMSINLGYAR